jgi:hypothetical protein
MADKVSAGAQLQLDVLVQARRKLDRLHTLVEQFSMAKPGPSQDSVGAQVSRTALELGRALLQNGMGVLADQANQLGMLARRGGGPNLKLRGMRDYVAQIRPGLERAEKSVHTKDAAKSAE